MEATESPRIEELRRRVQKDPTSIAFAQLAEEYRRVGSYEEAVDVCRAGLARHPTYLSARVTLGRALMELERYDEAQTELEVVLDLAPDNLAAIRALAEIHQRRGEVGGTPQKYTAALDLPLNEAPPAPPVEGDEPVVEITHATRGSEDPPLRVVEADLPASAEATAGEQVGPERIAEPEVHVRLEPPALVDPPLVAAPRSLEALDALDALTLDLPPAPDFSSWTLDTAWSLPSRPDVAPQGAGGPPARPAADPAIDELQQWLAAIVSDRANRR